MALKPLIISLNTQLLNLFNLFYLGLHSTIINKLNN